MCTLDTLLTLLESGGGQLYFGEAVSELEHALQTACLAEAAEAPDALVVAALLHDVGHLLHGLPETIANEGIDGRHEEAGAAWLERRFGPEVTAPVRLHVAAKRYLCATDAVYCARLSPASTLSLRLQGGPFTPEEAAAFARAPFAAEAMQLRRWDDEAKVPGLKVPGLEHYRGRLEALLAREAK